MNNQFLMNKAITVQYAFKKEGKGERHGTPAERLLAAQARKNNALPASARPPPASLNALAAFGPTGAATAVRPGMPGFQGPYQGQFAGALAGGAPAPVPSPAAVGMVPPPPPMFGAPPTAPVPMGMPPMGVPPPPTGFPTPAMGMPMGMPPPPSGFMPVPPPPPGFGVPPNGAPQPPYIPSR